MRTLFLNDRQQLRNGWWITIFVVCIAVTRVLHEPLKNVLKSLDVYDAWRHPLPVLMILLATWACMRMRRQPLSTIGLRLDRRWASELACGSALGIAMMALTTAMIAATGAVRFELDPSHGIGALAMGLYVFGFAALLEELLFRGFVFQRLIDGIGAWGAQITLAVLFAAAHSGNPGMEGAARLWATLDIGLAAAMLGLAYLRTRSLALPLGLHLGWNWMQGSVLGFGVSGHEHAGWWRPIHSGGQPAWLSGGEFGPEASIFSVVTTLIAIGLLWRWRGTAPPAGDIERQVTDQAPGLVTAGCPALQQAEPARGGG